jgi:hypothetical protein
MEKTHLHEEKTTWYKTQKSLLDDRQKFQIIPRQQIAALQSHSEARMNIWYPAMGLHY